MSFKDQKANDIAVFTNPLEFGSTAILNMDGIDREINVSFREGPDDLSGVQYMVHQVGLKRSEAPYLDKTATFIIEGERYRVVTIPEDYNDVDYPKVFVQKVDDEN